MTAPKKVLVVDDEQDITDLAEILLSSHGFAVVVAYSVVEALQVLENDDGIDVLFSDIMMPGMTGLQLARLVRDRYPRIKTILTSGYVNPDVLAKCDFFNAFLPKPYMIESVLELLRD